MRIDANTVRFLLLCVIWGTTWIGIKAGVSAVPPLVYAGTRFTVAGLLLLAITWGRAGGRAGGRGAGKRRLLPERRDMARLAAASLMMITLCYGPLFWGVKHVDSGTAAVIEMSLTPISLLCFAVALGQERLTAIQAGALVLGIAGLGILFGPEAIAGTRADPLYWLAAAAVAWSAVIYAWGSVLAKPLMQRYSPTWLAGVTTFWGGLLLILLALAVEPGAGAAFRHFWGWPAVFGWLFLVVFGSLIGYSIYMRLLDDIGASRAGAFAFVSPAIAVIAGVLVAGERVDALDICGMVTMSCGAFLSLHGDSLLQGWRARQASRA